MFLTQLGAWDYHAFTLINNMAGQYAILDWLMKGLSRYSPEILVAFLVYLWFKGRAGTADQRDHRTFVILAIAGTVFALAIGQVIGTIWFRPRPFTVHLVNMLLPHGADASFPSHHALAAFAITTAAWFYDKRTGIVFGIFAILVGISRPFVGAHYPLDIVGGAFIGIAAMTVVYKGRMILMKPAAFIVRIYEKIEFTIPGLRALHW